MQKQYLSIGNKDVYNGQYLLAIFNVETYRDIPLDDAATEIAAESSTGSNTKIGTITPFSESLNALVYKIDEEKNLVWIAYPWRIFDRGGNVQNIMTFIAGNVFGMGTLKRCKLLDIHFPTQMLVQYDGPSTTLLDLRHYLGVYDRPILGTIIKPKIGLTSSEYAEVCYDFWVGGGDFVKNDEPQADQDFCPFSKMVDGVRSAMDRAEQEDKSTKVHSFNVSAADFDTMLKRADYIRKVMKPGSYAFLVDGITAGWTAIQTMRRHHPDVFLHFHRAGHGANTRVENPFGFSVPVLTKMARLAGASAIHTGTAGVGKMSGTPEEDVTSAELGLRLEAKGPFFTQNWGEIAKSDHNIADAIEKESKIWQFGPHALSLYRKKMGAKSQDLQDLSVWRMLKPTAPIASGGLNPLKLAKFINVVGTIDFITTMGGGVHGHPQGTQAGARALRQAFQAWQEQISLEKYAEDHEELKVALDHY